MLNLHCCPNTSRWLGCTKPSTLTARDQPVLSADTREWLLTHAVRLQCAYDTTATPLGCGLVHADVQLDNLLRGRDGRWLLIDWDRASHGAT
jgi:thiamine kinase-like enzyme